jgi:MoaA/NifB/PqqE/SkfB family radical SAM enzyme
LVVPELLQIAQLASVDREAHRIKSLPVLVLNVHSRCNCRCVMCDIWKTTESRELSATDLERQMDSIRHLGVRWVVLTGGEPLLHSHLDRLVAILREENIRITLLTTGLLLKRHAAMVASSFNDVIISLDGPLEIHDRIRRVPNAFASVQEGIAALRAHSPLIEVGLRMTVQRANHSALRAAVNTAKELGVSWISFLAADLTSTAFNRETPWTAQHQSEIGLTCQETKELEREVDLLIHDCEEEIASGFIREDARKLRGLVAHFRAALGLDRPGSPICNAPWVSAVVEADGNVRPCFFHRSVGNLNRGTLTEVVNGDAALQFRSELDMDANRTCQNCVCWLNFPNQVGPIAAHSGAQ